MVAVVVVDIAIVVLVVGAEAVVMGVIMVVVVVVVRGVIILAVPVCKGPSSMVSSTKYAVLSRNQFCRELRAHGGG